MEQLQSLIAQVSHLTRLTATVPQWLLSDVYMDIATSKTGSSRKEFNRMLEDCKSHKLEIVITKDVSRFGIEMPLTSVRHRKIPNIYYSSHFD